MSRSGPQWCLPEGQGTTCLSTHAAPTPQRARLREGCGGARMRQRPVGWPCCCLRLESSSRGSVDSVMLISAFLGIG